MSPEQWDLDNKAYDRISRRLNFLAAFCVAAILYAALTGQLG